MIRISIAAGTEAADVNWKDVYASCLERSGEGLGGGRERGNANTKGVVVLTSLNAPHCEVPYASIWSAKSTI